LSLEVDFRNHLVQATGLPLLGPRIRGGGESDIRPRYALPAEGSGSRISCRMNEIWTCCLISARLIRGISRG
jgi:hypothetical protein